MRIFIFKIFVFCYIVQKADMHFGEDCPLEKYVLHFCDDLQHFLDSARPGDVLRLCAGEYRQKCVIRTPGLTLIGEGADRTRLIWDDFVKKLDGQGRKQP